MPQPAKRNTIARDSVFRSTVTPPPVRQGLSELPPASRQSAVWLSDDDMDWLDDRCQIIRKSGWRGINRSVFIRALIQAAKTKAMDVVGVAGEAELVEAIKRSL